MRPSKNISTWMLAVCSVITLVTRTLSQVTTARLGSCLKYTLPPALGLRSQYNPEMRGWLKWLSRLTSEAESPWSKVM